MYFVDDGDTIVVLLCGGVNSPKRRILRRPDIGPIIKKSELCQSEFVIMK